MKLLISKPFNLIAFNIVWFGCVIGRNDLSWFCAPLILGYATLLVCQKEVKFNLIAFPVCIGISIDSILTALGIFQFEETMLLVPLWLVFLWIAFSTTLCHSLLFIGRNKLAVVTTGAIALPLNYTIGERLGAVVFDGSYVMTTIVMSVTWAICLPLLFYFAESPMVKINETI